MKSIKTLALAAALTMTASTSMAVTLTGTFNVDNIFFAYISTDDSIAGTEFQSGTDWPTTYTGSADLVEGVTNYLHILAIDVGGPAGFLGAFSLDDTSYEFANGTQKLLTGEGFFGASTDGWQNYTTATIHGQNGSAPWGAISTNDDGAQWIWSADNQNDNAVYFSTAITQIAAVPLPASLPLLAGALGLFGFARSRKNRV